LGYVGPIATDFTYWAIVEAGSHLRASTMAVALLATPPLGIVISACALHESLDRTGDSGVLLISLGITPSAQRAHAAHADAPSRLVSLAERAEERPLVTQKAAGFLSVPKRRLALRVSGALDPELFVGRKGREREGAERNVAGAL